MMKMIDWIMGKLGFVHCSVCGRFTEPSVIIGNICSAECLNKCGETNE